jgi:glycosyltransferase involved in cell wall biosynthesis
VVAVLVPDAGVGADWVPATGRSLGAAAAAKVLSAPASGTVRTPGAAILNDAWAAHGGHLLVVSAGVVPPPDFLDRALAAIEGDPRIATVSFLTNDGGMLSYPDRNVPTPLAPDGHTQDSITTRLRTLSPTAGLAEIPFGLGPVVLISDRLLRIVGPFGESPTGSIRASVADLCLRASARGFSHLVDFGTFVLKPSDLNQSDWSAEPWAPRPPSDLSSDDDAWLSVRHPVAGSSVHSESTDEDSAFGLGFNLARVKVQGVRVLIDGRSLAGAQQGTQTATMCLVEALGRHPGVRDVCVALSGEPPTYARAALSGEGVRVVTVGSGDLGTCGRFDVGHRPFLPGDGYAPEEWRGVADRHLVTVLDLIAFNAGDYFRSPEGWHEYRARVRDMARLVDGIVVISDDVRDAVARAALPVDRSRVFVVPLGTDHLGPQPPPEPSPDLAARGLAGGPFLLCLGTNYACRNRDVAIGAWHALREQGHGLDLVLVGGAVPFGSTRLVESQYAGAEGLHDLPSVSADDRNWLLAHASLVLCTSSADGFGFVPFEAARLGTASASVRF